MKNRKTWAIHPSTKTTTKKAVRPSPSFLVLLYLTSLWLINYISRQRGLGNLPSPSLFYRVYFATAPFVGVKSNES